MASPTMTLDQAIAAVQAAEAPFNTAMQAVVNDTNQLSTDQASLTAATAPYQAALQQLVTVAQAAEAAA